MENFKNVHQSDEPCCVQPEDGSICCTPISGNLPDGSCCEQPKDGSPCCVK